MMIYRFPLHPVRDTVTECPVPGTSPTVLSVGEQDGVPHAWICFHPSEENTTVKIQCAWTGHPFEIEDGMAAHVGSLNIDGLVCHYFRTF